ncbi:eukaryotic porin/Tom40 [Lipomyces japonicus]|uniref:eukaryotic porin/Tom40 n=1 Tax=Lipomyces japonicus TaxID=56871 RepID=UPI0034CE39E6
MAADTPVLPYSDIAKKPNDLLSRDFFHAAPASVEVKTKADNGVTFNVKGKSSPKDNSVSGSFDVRYSDPKSNIALTQSWSTANVVDVKVELPEFIPKLKTDVKTSFVPTSGTTGFKVDLRYRQPLFTTFVFADIVNRFNFISNFSFGKAGTVAGGQVAYDVKQGRVTNYAAAIGYNAPAYSIALTAAEKLTAVSAAYYHKATPSVEVGGKATWDWTSTQQVNFEFATKYTIDTASSAKAKVNNAGVVALSYLLALHKGVKVGLGISVDTQRLNEPAHKAGVQFTFEN